MTTTLEPLQDLIAFLLEALGRWTLEQAARGTAVLIVTTTAALLLRRQSAGVRHLTLRAGLLALLLLPLVSMLVPQVAVLPAAARIATGFAPDAQPEPTFSEQQTPSETPPIPLGRENLPEDSKAEVVELLPDGNNQSSRELLATANRNPADEVWNSAATTSVSNIAERTGIRYSGHVASPAAADGDPATTAFFTISPRTYRWIGGIAFGGSLLLLIRLFVSGIWLVRRSHLSQAHPDRDPATDVRSELSAIKQRLGCPRQLRVAIGTTGMMPMVYGMIRPVLLLPPEFLKWSRQRREIVLLHEVGHVIRRDPIWQCLIELTGVLFWFHPGYWIARRWCADAREQSCDDLVLTAGVAPADYASQLLGLVSELRGTRLMGAVGVAMAQPGQLERRIRNVLDLHRRRSKVTRRMAVVTALASACVLLPVATITSAAPLVEQEDQRQQPQAGLPTLPDSAAPSAVQLTPRIPVIQQPVIDTSAPTDTSDGDVTALSDTELMNRLRQIPEPNALPLSEGMEIPQTKIDSRFTRQVSNFRNHSLQMLQQHPVIQEVRRRKELCTSMVNDLLHERLRELSLRISPGTSPYPTSGLTVDGLPRPGIIVPAYVAGVIGDRESAKLLIDLLQLATNKENDGIQQLMLQQSGFVAFASLWNLTGRQHAINGEQWKALLEQLGDDFVPAHQRATAAAGPDAVAASLTRLPQQEAIERERLIATGPAVVPLLKAAIDASDPQQQTRIVWILDEIGDVADVDRDVMERYYVRRLSQQDLQVEGVYLNRSADSFHTPIEVAARVRCLNRVPLATFVRLCREVDRLRPTSLPF
ncbi:MAG: M56 family metallopeptidase, partial [Planctomycetaceae bacterium]|nr:M56 family metallopeptidase [Planctomycetaceae bacterium]